ncbi:MAG: hypothetical protein NC299_14835 [Lachnospiraceae bacterium]|nr:hypothetical protein [Lachnospiraceae bacterium]
MFLNDQQAIENPVFFGIFFQIEHSPLDLLLGNPRPKSDNTYGSSRLSIVIFFTSQAE